MIAFIGAIYSFLIAMGRFLQPVILLAMRLYWGWGFYIAGVAKLQDIEKTVESFNALGIPFATVNTYLAGTAECVGGICLMLGLASRLVSIPLIFVMVVALFTAHHEAVVNILTNPEGFVSQAPFNYLLTALIVFAFGPGILSVDAILKRAFRPQT